MKAKRKDEYPIAWQKREIQRAMYALAGWKCEHCGLKFPEGQTTSHERLRRDGKPTVLTVHHLNGNKNDLHHTNLLVCCQHCHLHIQGVWQPGLPIPWDTAPQWLIKRGLAYSINPRLEGF